MLSAVCGATIKVMGKEIHQKDPKFVEPMCYTPAQIARKLNKSVDWVYAQIHAEAIPAFRLGGEWRVSGSAFEKYIAELNGEKDRKSAIADAKAG